MMTEPDMEPQAFIHEYLSTACLHGLHGRCRRTCKFCLVLCGCLHPKCPCAQVRQAAENRLDITSVS